MAWESADHQDESYKAASDLSTLQFMAVELNSDGKAAIDDGDGAPIGILQDKPAAANRACAVRTHGLSKAQCSGTITRGAYLAPSGNGTVSGYLIATTTDRDEYIAASREAHTADGATCILTVDVIKGQISHA